MSRRYDEQVEVRWGAAREHGVRVEGALPGGPGDAPEVPTLFLWRGRVHVVRAVLARWTQRVPWWRTDTGTEAGAVSDVELEVDAGGDPSTTTAGPELEWVVWRVEAGAGRSSGTGVYDLVQGEQWRLDRVSD